MLSSQDLQLKLQESPWQQSANFLPAFLLMFLPFQNASGFI